jgi:hypothetical protein
MTDEELKERATSLLKRTSDIASSATKVALLSLGAIAAIWFAEVRPESRKFLDKIDSEYLKPYRAIIEYKRRIEKIREDFKKGNVEEDKKVVREQEERALKIAAQKTTTAETKKPIEKFTFKIFGLEIKIAPVYASVVSNVLLLLVVMYLAQARFVVWTLCAEALLILKTLKKPLAYIEDVAGSGPLWLAPSPSRVKEGDAVTIDELRSAFGWNRLQTLPGLAATVGYLLLGLLQMDVTSLGLKVVRTCLELNPALRFFGRDPTSDSEFTEMVLGPNEASLLSVIPLLALVGTMALVIWWFLPWTVPSRLKDAGRLAQRVARLSLIVTIAVALTLILAALLPEHSLQVTDRLAAWLPELTRAVIAGVVTFCLVQLIAQARTPSIATEILDGMVTHVDGANESRPHIQNTKESDGTKSVLLLSRRHILSSGLSGLAALMALTGSKLITWLAGGTKRQPRFRRRKMPAVWQPMSKLQEGFYAKISAKVVKTTQLRLSSKPTIIHYVDENRRALFVQGLKERHLRKADPKQLTLKPPITGALRKTEPNKPVARVHYARASAIFELAALQQIKNKKYDEACRLLINGIRHDLDFKKKIGSGPSVRLYDLLAKVAVRHQQNKHIQSLRKLANEAKALVAQQNVGRPPRRRHDPSRTSKVTSLSTADRTQRRQKYFANRVQNWSNPKSEWWKRVTNTSQPLVWAVPLAPDTTRNQNKVTRVEL